MGGTRLEVPGQLRLLDEQTESLKKLNGFKKHHRVPESVGSGYQQFLGEIVAEDIDAELQNYFGLIRSSFGLKRKQISVSGPTDGSGIISTPWFNYEIFVTGTPADPSRIVWQRAIDNIQDWEPLFSPTFGEVFKKRFSVLEWSPDGPIDLEAAVDHVEDVEPNSISIDYDKDLSWVQLALADSTVCVRMTSESVRIDGRSKSTPRQLIEDFMVIHSRILEALGDGPPDS